MLFDLRGRGRRRTIQVIYLSLALLLGGGLVLFGIGGDVQGGLFDAFRDESGGGNDVLQEDVDKAQERVDANPRDAAAWAALAESKANLANQSEGVDPNTGTYGGESRQVALEAVRAWDRHVSLAGPNVDDGVARVILLTHEALGQPRKAFDTWNHVVDVKKNPDSSDFQRLAELAYLSGDPELIRTGDRFAERTIDKAREEGESKDRIDQLRNGFAQLKAEVQQEQGGAAAPTP